MAGSPPKVELLQRWFIALAALALMVQVLVPPGFMVSGERRSPGLVVCTGHGPMQAMDEHPAPGKPPKTADHACAFAGHGTAAPSASAMALETVSFSYAEAPVPPTFDLTPGRGLAAPPPQSHAPPSVLI
jgi:hypothetical protein